MAAATAGLPKTAACSPKTMNFPGADTMNAGAIGDEAFLSMTFDCEVHRERTGGWIAKSPLTEISSPVHVL